MRLICLKFFQSSTLQRVLFLYNDTRIRRIGDLRLTPPGSGSVDRAREGRQGRESGLQIEPLPAPIGWRSDFRPFGGVNGHVGYASVMDTGLVGRTRRRCPGGTLPASGAFAGPEGPEARSSPTGVSGADRIRISDATVTGRPGPPPRQTRRHQGRHPWHANGGAGRSGGDGCLVVAHRHGEGAGIGARGLGGAHV